MVETIINDSTIERVSEIARLKLSDKEKVKFREEFERILEEFSIIDEIKALLCRRKCKCSKKGFLTKTLQ